MATTTKLIASNFIPELWSARLLAHLDKTLVFKNVVNSDYAGTVKNLGDSVRINQIGNISISSQSGSAVPASTMGTAGPDYVTTTSPDTITGTQKVLNIDQMRYFAFRVDDVHEAQANVDLMENAMERAAYGLADSVDQFLAGMYTEATTAIGSDEAPVELTAANIYEKLVDMAIKLDEKNVPAAGRFVVITPAIYGLLLKDDRFVKTGADAADARLGNGYVGEVAGMKVYKSNNICKGETEHAAVGTAGQDGYVAAYDEDNYKIIAGHPIAITFAEQISKVESLRDQDSFADIVRGYLVMGSKCVQPDALVCMTATI